MRRLVTMITLVCLGLLAFTVVPAPKHNTVTRMKHNAVTRIEVKTTPIEMLSESVAPSGHCFGCPEQTQEACVLAAQSVYSNCMAFVGFTEAQCYQQKLSFLNACIFRCVQENL